MGDEPRNGPGPSRRLTRGVLLRYQVMAFTTAVLLIVLVFLGIPLQFAAGEPAVVNVVGTLHGFLYLVYLVVAFDLTRRLRVPWWQMALVLLAGTVPFCAFVAEAKMSRRFRALTGADEEQEPGTLKRYATGFRRRWFSRRAMLLHLYVLIVAPGCALAGWWQATRALGGNELSWVYSVEWPIFALLAIGGWWQLVHEDPEAYRARKHGPPGDPTGTAVVPLESGEVELPSAVDPVTRRLAARLAVLCGAEAVLGIMAVLSVPFSRPSGFVPEKGLAIYLTHTVVGLAIAVGAGLLVMRAGRSRSSQAVAWLGAVGVGLAGIGGLLTGASEVIRFLGIAVMTVGTIWAGFSYMIPVLVVKRRRVAVEPAVATPSLEHTGP